MVAYGLSLQDAQRSGWEGAYLDYENLKAVLEQMEHIYHFARQSPIIGDDDASASAAAADDESARDGSGSDHISHFLQLGQQFVTMLRDQIEKISLFTLKREGYLANEIGSIRHDRLPAQSAIASSSSSNHIFGESTLQGADVDDLNEAYCRVGVELLHLLRFICVNVIGIRKLLKKHHKALTRMIVFAEASREHASVNINDGAHLIESRQHELLSRALANGADGHLQSLVHSHSISALHASLWTALQEQRRKFPGVVDDRRLYQDAEAKSGNSPDSETPLQETPTALVRFHYIVASIQTIRKHAGVVNAPFQNFLSRKAMILTGSNLGSIEGSALGALQSLLGFEPTTILSITRLDLMDWYENSMTMARIGAPVNFQQKELWLDPKEMVMDESGIPPDGDLRWGGVDSTSLAINLLSTLLYTVNYYIVAPTANRYAILLGTDGAFGATLLGASSFAAIFAAFLYSYWYTVSSFRSALIFSALCPLFGNLCYSLALSYHSMRLALLGRVLCGFGSAEVANRQLISACVSFKKMTRASAFFVGTGAVGMSLGPLLAAILDIVAGRDTEIDAKLPFLPAGGIIYNHVTSPGFFMTSLWFCQLLLLIFLFREPDRINGKGAPEVSAEISVSRLDNPEYESFEDEPQQTKYGTTDLISASRTEAAALSARSTSRARGAWNEICKTGRLLVDTPALPVTLLLFGFIELVDEVLISSCSMICLRYFGWNGSSAGFLIASLGALVLPADFVVEQASRKYSERRIMKISIMFLIIGLLSILNWEAVLYDVVGAFIQWKEGAANPKKVTIFHEKVKKLLNKHHEFPFDGQLGQFVYIAALSSVFMGTIILEGVDTSLMAKVTPIELNTTFLNSGLLATLVGTLGRVFADSMITASALLDVHVFVDFANATFAPLLLLALIGYMAVKKFYAFLEPM